MVGHAERHQHEGLASNLHDDDLEDKDGDHDYYEKVVIEEVLEDIGLLLLQLSRIEEVEHLQVDEDVEEESQMLTGSLVPFLFSQPQRTLNSEVLVSLEENESEDNDLINGVENDRPPHLGVDDVLVSGVGHPE